MFENRTQAGKLLADKIVMELEPYSIDSVTILAVPRGGVLVAKEIAEIPKASLDVIITKKLAAPGKPELAFGAVGQTEGSIYIDQRIVRELQISQDYIDQAIVVKQKEIAEREQRYRAGKTEIELREKRVIIVDDGAATGATMVAAAREVWNRQPKQVIIALPVCAKHTLRLLEQEADMVISLATPDDFYAVGQFYEDFEQVSDEEVMSALQYTNLSRNAK